MSKPATEGEFWSPIVKKMRLITAAPDLLAACEASLKMFDHTIGRPLVTDEQKLLKAAIAKAKGGAA